MRIVKMLKDLRKEDGQVMVLTLLSMTVLMGFMALAVDVSALYNARRRVQTTADAAAIAGALSYDQSGSMTTAAQAATTAAGNNGMAPYISAVGTTSVSPNAACTDLTKNCLEVYFAPNIANAYHNTSGYMEAIVAQPNPSIFMNAFSAMFGAPSVGQLPVSAKAVAGIVPATPCMIILDPNSQADALEVKGAGKIIAPGCGIQDNSTSNDAFCLHDNGVTLDVASVSVSGGNGCSPGSYHSPTNNIPVYDNQAQAADPFAGLPDATTACGAGNTYTGTSLNNTQATALLATAATMTSGSQTAKVICFQNNVTLSDPSGTMNLGATSAPPPGAAIDTGYVFVFENGVVIPNGQTVNVTGTMDNAHGVFNQQTNSNLSIYAPGSDNNSADKALIYNSIALMQPATNTTSSCPSYPGSAPAIPAGVGCLGIQFGSSGGSGCSSTGTSTENLEGEIYAPQSMVFMQDQGGGVQAAGIISYMLFTNSQLCLTNNYNNANPLSTPLRSVQLVE